MIPVQNQDQVGSCENILRSFISLIAYLIMTIQKPPYNNNVLNTHNKPCSIYNESPLSLHRKNSAENQYISTACYTVFIIHELLNCTK